MFGFPYTLARVWYSRLLRSENPFTRLPFHDIEWLLLRDDVINAVRYGRVLLDQLAPYASDHRGLGLVETGDVLHRIKPAPEGRGTGVGYIAGEGNGYKRAWKESDSLLEHLCRRLWSTCASENGVNDERARAALTHVRAYAHAHKITHCTGGRLRSLVEDLLMAT